jgi:hypothetical protein
VGIALGTGLFAALVFILINEMPLTPRTAGEVLLMAASQCAAGLGVMLDGAMPKDEPPRRTFAAGAGVTVSPLSEERRDETP